MPSDQTSLSTPARGRSRIGVVNPNPEDERRPSPEEILARMNGEAEQESRGKLRVFFGAVAGVGKTYAMLEQAHARRREGIDVVGRGEEKARSEEEEGGAAPKKAAQPRAWEKVGRFARRSVLLQPKRR